MNINLSSENWWNDRRGRIEEKGQKKTCPCATPFITNTARPASNQTQASAVSLCNNRSSLFALFARTMLVIHMVYRQITLSANTVVSQPRQEPQTSHICEKRHHFN